MKFRYRILIVNIIVLSLGLGIVGYLMIRRNFDLASQTQLKNAITENNLVQSSVEYELLEKINNEGGDIDEMLVEVGRRVMDIMITDTSAFYIRYGEDYIYSGDDREGEIPEALFANLLIGSKNYVICKAAEEEKYYAYVTSYSEVEKTALCIVSRQEISDVYYMLEEQIRYFRLLLVSVVLIASVIVYRICKYLTEPLENLNRVTEEIAKGNYNIHAGVTGTDEVGQLAGNVNIMADAVLSHVEELKDMIYRREQFVADFTHEIKTPITTMIACADMVRSMELPREEQIRALTYVFSEGKRLETMAQKLFQLIYLKQHEIEKMPMNTKNVERDMLRIATPILQQKGMNLQVDVEEAVLEGDAELLNTVFLNLIDNGRKASKEGDTIWLKGRCIREETGSEEYSGAVYEFDVRDCGIGMSEESVTHICDEFYMVDKSRSRKEGGAGLGLSLAALIIKQHGAFLQVESEIGKGTTMRVIFYDKKIKESNE